MPDASNFARRMNSMSKTRLLIVGASLCLFGANTAIAQRQRPSAEKPAAKEDEKASDKAKDEKGKDEKAKDEKAKD
jgi:hypothetical protein